MQSWISFPVFAEEALNYFDHLTVNPISQIFVNSRNINEVKVKVNGKIASELVGIHGVRYDSNKKQLIRCFVNNPPHLNEKKKVFLSGQHQKQWG